LTFRSAAPSIRFLNTPVENLEFLRPVYLGRVLGRVFSLESMCAAVDNYICCVYTNKLYILNHGSIIAVV